VGFPSRNTKGALYPRIHSISAARNGVRPWHAACTCTCMKPYRRHDGLTGRLFALIMVFGLLMVVLAPACPQGLCGDCAKRTSVSEQSSSPLQPVAMPPLAAEWAAPALLVTGLVATFGDIGADQLLDGHLSSRLRI
jgi:hypothetical protein